MKRCPKCKKKLDENITFCPNCGSQLVPENNHMFHYFLIAILLVGSFFLGLFVFNLINGRQNQVHEKLKSQIETQTDNADKDTTAAADKSDIHLSESSAEQATSTESHMDNDEGDKKAALTESGVNSDDNAKESTKTESQMNSDDSVKESAKTESQVSSDDSDKEPVMATPLTIVIDPGRGGQNMGKQFTYNDTVYYEKDINLQIGRFLSEELQQFENVTVIMTRSEDIDVELEDRVKIAAGSNADVLVSLHNDTNGDVEDYPDGCLVLTARGVYRPELAEEEQKLAASILKELSGIGLTDRGILLRRAENGVTYADGQVADYYAIVRNGIIHNVPSILIEHTCMDNPEDFSKYLSSEESLRSLAKADAQGIANYYGLTEKSSGNICKIDSAWEESYTYRNFYGEYGHSITSYTHALSKFGADTEWRPPVSLVWKSSESDCPSVEESGTDKDCVDFSFFHLNDTSTTREIGMALGLTEGHSDVYQNYYASGDQIELGVNERKQPYRIVHNFGNPNFTVNGIRIGMDADTCRTLLNKKYSYYSTKLSEDGTEYDVIVWAEYGSMQFIYGADGKLKEWQENLIWDTSE